MLLGNYTLKRRTKLTFGHTRIDVEHRVPVKDATQMALPHSDELDLHTEHRPKLLRDVGPPLLDLGVVLRRGEHLSPTAQLPRASNPGGVRAPRQVPGQEILAG